MSVISSFEARKVTVDTFQGPIGTGKLITDSLGNFVEAKTGRRVRLHGINFASNSKLPSTPFQPTYIKPHKCGLYTEADHVSFVGKPFPLSDAYEHIIRVKQCGFNTIRFVFTWEAIEHEGPGIYDLEYADYVVEVLKIIDEIGGIYVFMDPHQDVWSRFSGGSGAPLWTLYAAGLNPENFKNTLAARIQYDSTNPAAYTKMLWATNYYRLASELMFTMFFSGETFLPKCIMDGVNIQEYLQDHFISSVAFLMNHIKVKIPGIFDTCLLGVESLNEPNHGMYGFTDLNDFPANNKLKLDEIPTPIESLRLAMGISQKISTFHLSIFGPTKKGHKLWHPDGKKAWIENDEKDKHYGFDRGSQWKLGECILAQHGVWDSKTGELLKPDYFLVHPHSGALLDEDTFINGPFLQFWDKFRKKMREIDPEMFIIMQPPVLLAPPRVKNTNYVDENTVVALHYYDGMSLMFKSWNRFMNVDTLGIVRKRYWNPAFSIVFGESRIRTLIARQLKEMNDESKYNVGESIPVIFSETGMPYDMDSKRAYQNGDYKSQESANDALLTALEISNLNFTYWTYNPDNNHEWGDLWNLEDFSIWSRDDKKDSKLLKGTSYSEWLTKNSSSTQTLLLNSDDRNSIYSTNGTTIGNNELRAKGNKGEHSYGLESQQMFNIDTLSGIRCPRATIRPSVILCNGLLSQFDFNIGTGKLQLEIENSKTGSALSTLSLDGSEESRLIYNNELHDDHRPTVILLPEIHYPENSFQIEVSKGEIVLKRNGINQWLEWNYPLDESMVSLEINSLKEDEEGEDLRTILGRLKELACGYY